MFPQSVIEECRTYDLTLPASGPQPLSWWLDQAISDLVSVRQDPNYQIDMTIWHGPVPLRPCLVCFAGALLAKSFGFPDRRPLDHVSALPWYVGSLMLALDRFRTGDCNSAIMSAKCESAADPRKHDLQPDSVQHNPLFDAGWSERARDWLYGPDTRIEVGERIEYRRDPAGFCRQMGSIVSQLRNYSL